MATNIYTPRADDGLEPEEQKLVNLVNQYRAQKGLPAISVSPALTLVANRHVHDLAENIGKLTHDWSDPAITEIIPHQFNTGYPTTGASGENAYWNSGGANAQNTLIGWQNSPGHNAILLNSGGSPWNAIGIGIYGQYAMLIVGTEKDTTSQYLASNPDLIASFGSNTTAALNHYIESGRFEGRSWTNFDPFKYLASNTDLINVFGTNTTAATEHYITTGYHEGRKANFDAFSYLAKNPDLIGVFGANTSIAAQHYVTAGYYEGRSVSFDALSYIASYGDLISAFGTNTTAATQHYVTAGYYEGRKTNFDAFSYLAKNPDLIGVFGANTSVGTQHYVTTGYHEGRSVSFDALSYIASYGDLIGVFGTNATAATQHYVIAGYYEGRGVSFDVSFYLAKYPDIRSAFGVNLTEATKHFINTGYKEGRVSSNAGNDNLIGSNLNDVIKAGAGNDTIDAGAGSDILTGGIGTDIFKFTSLNGIDNITDFSVVDDTIQLENAVFTSFTTTGALSASNFVLGSASLDSDDFLIYNPSSGTLSYDADGNGIGAAVQIALLGISLAVNNTNFIII